MVIRKKSAPKQRPKKSLDAIVKEGRMPAYSRTPTWAWNWVGGGYNSTQAATKSEALAAAKKIWPIAEVDLSTLRIVDDAELRMLDNRYV